MSALELNDALPSAPFRERHRRRIGAPVADVWRSTLAVTPHEIRAMGPLMALRTLPRRLTTGRADPGATEHSPLLTMFEHEGFVPLRVDAAPSGGRAVAVYGAAGRFWSATHNEPRRFGSAQEFLDFREPGHATLAFSIEAVERNGHTELVTETHVGGTDPSAVRRFAPYWALIRLPSGLIRRSWLAAIDRRAAGGALRWRELWPRRATGLPPGQRELTVMPRFADQPLRKPPPTPQRPTLTVSRSGEVLVELDLDELAGLDQCEIVADFHCVTTWSVRDRRWNGVRLADVLTAALGDAPPPPFLVARGGDGVRAVLCTEDVLGPDVLVATHLDGQPLDLRHGAPLRLVSPGQYGYKNVKHLMSIELCGTQPASTFGNKEHLRARVAHEERHATLPNWLLRWPYRAVVPITARIAERSARRPN